MEAGHKAVMPADLEVPEDATPRQVLEMARKNQVELIVDSRQVLDSMLHESGRPETFGRTLVFFREVDAGEAVQRLVARHKRLNAGRLYTVTASSVKVSQLPTAGPV